MTDFEINQEDIAAGRPITSPAILSGAAGFDSGAAPSHSDPTETAEYYKFYYRGGAGERRNPRLPRPNNGSRFSSDQWGALNTAHAAAISNGSDHAAALISPDMAVDFTEADEAVNLTRKVASERCYVEHSADFWVTPTGLHVLRAAFEWLAVHHISSTLPVCQLWHKDFSALVVNAAAAVVRKTQVAQSPKRKLPEPRSAGRSGLATRLNAIQNSSAKIIQSAVRRFMAVSAAQRTQGLLHILERERRSPSTSDLIENKAVTPLGFFLELALEYEYNLHVLNMAQQIVITEREKLLAEGDFEKAALSVPIRRCVLTADELDEVYANVENNYADNFTTFPADAVVPSLHVFLGSFGNAHAFSTVMKGVIERDAGKARNGQAVRLSYARDVNPLWYDESFLRFVIDKENAGNVQHPRKAQPEVQRLSAAEELSRAVADVPSSWFAGGDVDGNTLTEAAAEGECPKQQLTTVPAPDFAVVPPPMGSTEELLWPEAVDPFCRPHNDLDGEDDPELMFHDSSDDEFDGHGEQVGSTHLSFDAAWEREEQKANEQRTRIIEKLQSGANVATSTHIEMDEASVEFVVGGRATKQHADTVSICCVVCELDGVDCAQCVQCGSWVHSDCGVRVDDSAFCSAKCAKN